MKKWRGKTLSEGSGLPILLVGRMDKVLSRKEVEIDEETVVRNLQRGDISRRDIAPVDSFILSSLSRMQFSPKLTVVSQNLTKHDEMVDFYFLTQSET